MNLYLKIFLKEIDLVASGLEEVSFDVPSDLRREYCECGLITIDHPVRNLYIEHLDSVFEFVDRLEGEYIKEGHNVEWDWEAMRKNNTYYLSVFIETLSDHFDEVQCIIDSIISNRAQPIETLSWPEYYYEPQDIIGRCWGIDEYNDDSDLRLSEKCTKKDKRIEWFRPRPEKEGAGDNLLADLASAITILAFLWHAYFWCKRFIVKQDYNWKIKRLKKILLSKYIKGGISCLRDQPFRSTQMRKRKQKNTCSYRNWMTENKERYS